MKMSMDHNENTYSSNYRPAREHVEIEISSKKQCYWLFTYLLRRRWFEQQHHVSQRFPVLKDCDHLEIEQLVKNTFSWRSQLTIVDRMTADLYQKIVHQYLVSKIDDNDISWIDTTYDRVVNACWFKVRLHEELKYENNQSPTRKIIYPITPIEQTPVSTKSRRKTIKDFFHFWEESAVEKIRFINYLKDFSNSLSREDNLSKWLSVDNFTQHEWAANYLIEQRDFPYSALIQSINPAQLYSNIIASVDCWAMQPDQKTLFLIRIKKAWATQKHRLSRQDKKSYNFVMSKSVSKKLDKLAISNELSKSELVEKLITDELKRHYSNGGKSSE
tara:strand:+ start:286 stop:1278 length:993 start_codon:yes stop_codon:yes gene_type:complete